MLQLLCSLFVSVLISLGFLYVYLIWHFNYWTKRKIPGPKPAPVYGTFPGMVNAKRNFIYDLDEVYRQFKTKAKFVGVFVVRSPQIMILDPQMCKDILITNFKCFQDNESSQWLALHYTGEVVADIGWGIEAGNFRLTNSGGSQEDTLFLNMSKQMIAQTFNAFKYFFIAGIFPFVRYLVYVRFFPEVTDRFFLQLTCSAIKMRQTGQNARQDFMQHMLDLQQKKGISETEIVAHQLTLLFDGFETSATLISHCLLLLARHPDKQQKLRLEIQHHLTDHSYNFDFDDLIKLPYLEQCLAETLRIFTPLAYMAKVCTQSCELVNNDGVALKVQPGHVCLISFYSIHHDKEYYPQPEKFMPERFVEENGGTKKFKDMGVYFLFGDGPPICLGMKFALSQSKAVIAEIIEHFDLTVNERTRKDNRLAADGFLTGLDGGIFLDIKEL